MHEMSIAQSLLKEVVTAARRYGAERVGGLTFRVGSLRLVENDQLRAAFAACAQGTIAEGCSLSIESVPAQSRCRSCGADYSPELLSFLCPKCGRADAELLAGEELILTNLDLEVSQQEVCS